MESHAFTSARELFEAAMEASRDIDRCRAQMGASERAALRVASPSLAGHVSGTGDPDRIGARVATMVDLEAALSRRMEEDYALIDAAARVLYGDGDAEGLRHLVPAWWADAIYQHYVNCLTWAVVGRLMGVSETYAKRCARAALDVADAYGMAATVSGTGMAEG